jgi:hypothetical protein
MAFYWLWSLGTTLTFAALTAKLYRIHRIFTNQALKSIALSSQHMFGAVTLLCLVDIVLMLLWQLVAPLHYVEVVLEQGPYSEPLATRGTCISSHRPHHEVLFIALVVVYVCLLFVAGVTYSYMVRKVDSEFQESQWITIALVSQFQLYLVGIPLVVIFSSVNGWGRFFVVSSVVLLNNLVLLTVMFWPKVHAVSKRLQRAASLATIASDRKPPGGGAHAAAEDDPESLPLRNPSYALRSGSFKSANQSSYRTVDEGDRPFIERVEHLLVLRRASSSVSLSAGESPRKQRHVGLQVNVSDHVSEVSVDDAPASDNEPAPPASLPASVPTPPRSTAKSKPTLSGEKSRESQDTGQPSSTEELECKRD